MKTLRLYAALALLLIPTRGFADYTINLTAHQSRLLANQLNNPAGNDLNTVLAGVPVASKAVVSKWNCVGFSSATHSVASWSPDLTVLPGEGFILNPSVATTLTFTGTPVTPVYPNPYLCACGVPSIVSSQTTNATAMYQDVTGLAPVEGVQLYRHIVGMPLSTPDWTNYTVYVFWGGSWTPSPPQVNLGEAVWVMIPCPCINVTCPSNKIVPCDSSWDFDVPIVVSNCCGTNVATAILSTVTNNVSPLTVTRTWQITNSCTNSVLCSQTVTASGPPPNDECSTAIALTQNTSYSFCGSTACATPSAPGTLPSDPCGASVNSPDVWYRFNTTCSGTAFLDTCGTCPSGTPFNTVLTVYQGTCGALTEIACNDDSAACSPQSALTFPVTSCTNYFVRVSGNNGAAGQFQFQLGISPDPLTLSISKVDTNIILTWPGCGTLQQKFDLSAPTSWMNVPGATSPYIVPSPDDLLDGLVIYRVICF